MQQKMPDDQTYMVDVSQAGSLLVAGSGSMQFMHTMFCAEGAGTNEIGSLTISPLLNAEGQVIDVCWIMRTGNAEYMVITAADNREEVFEWLDAHSKIEREGEKAFGEVVIEDHTDAIALVILFGPLAFKTLDEVDSICKGKAPILMSKFSGSAYGVLKEPSGLLIVPANVAAQVGDILNENVSLERLDPEEYRDLLVAESSYEPSLYDAEYALPSQVHLENLLRKEADFVGAHALFA